LDKAACCDDRVRKREIQREETGIKERKREMKVATRNEKSSDCCAD
jgi:hypothetical protein